MNFNKKYKSHIITIMVIIFSFFVSNNAFADIELNVKLDSQDD
jgi:hypothetical protein